METVKRKSFQGLLNIVRFNYPFYVAICLGIAMVLVLQHVFSFAPIGYLLTAILLLPLIVSLLVSYYVYDFSGLYEFGCFEKLKKSEAENFLNIHAGFDETSRIIQQKFPRSKLVVADFYQAEEHTEPSIKRARKLYPAMEGTISVKTENLPWPKSVFDKIFIVFAAHEIRRQAERVRFFIELERVLKDDGEIIVVEHLRDLPNFFAYTIGFFHFFSKASWLRTIAAAGFTPELQLKSTPFVHVFILKKNGTAS